MFDKPTYQTLTGRHINLVGITRDERAFLRDALTKYFEQPEWSEFSTWWQTSYPPSVNSADRRVRRVCYDLESRLGIVQGTVAFPDYRDYLADLIDEKYPSRYRFCQDTAIDQAHLSRVIAGHADLSLDLLQKAAAKLGSAIILLPQADLTGATCLERSCDLLAHLADDP
jgi:hypothetical protein